MSWKKEHVANWQEFLKWVDELGDEKFLFRGQHRDYGTLQPSLVRLAGNGATSKDIEDIERDLTAAFYRESLAKSEEAKLSAGIGEGPKSNPLVRWGFMQHHGAPTRVLDWTGSPFVAAYFAVEKDFDKPGEIVCYKQHVLEKHWQKHGLNHPAKDLEIDDYRNGGKNFGEKPFVHHFIHQIQSSRMVAQQGVFTVCTNVLCDHAEILAKWLGEDRDGISYHRFIIPKGQKLSFLAQLRKMNITGASLFPDIDGVGRKTAESAKLRFDSLPDHVSLSSVSSTTVSAHTFEQGPKPAL